MIKFCSNCGFKLEGSYNFCPQCGSEIGKSATGKVGHKKNKPVTKASENSDTKSLNPKVLYGILGGGVIIVLIILFGAGVFEGTETQNNFTSPPVNQSPGVDLSAIQKLNQLEEKVKANPNDHQSLLDLAHLKNDSGLFEQAIVNYKTYLEHHPEDADARIDMGVCYFNLRDYSTANMEMEKALQYSPKHQIGHLNLGVVNLNAGNIEKAKEWFQKAVEIDPNSEAGKRAQELLKSH